MQVVIVIQHTCFMIFSKFGHQGALGPLFTFSTGLNFNMCHPYFKGFLFAR